MGKSIAVCGEIIFPGNKRIEEWLDFLEGDNLKTAECLSREKPLVSVIVPVYKAERFLERAVMSVVQQSYENWEMILVDDGSPDCCGVMCDGYSEQDCRIHVIHQENQGLSAARNAGMAACHGEYLYFMDSDDYIAPDTLQILLDYALPKKADIVMHGHYHVKAGGVEDAVDWAYSEDAEAIRDAILLDRIPNFAWAKLFRKSLWGDIRFPLGVLMEDLYTIPPIFYRAKTILLVPDRLYFYCENAGSIMNAVNIEAYIRARYGKFLAWKEHGEAAHRYRPPLESACVAKAAHSALRAYTMTLGTGMLSDVDRGQMKEYLASCGKFSLSPAMQAGRFLVLHGPKLLISFAGWIEREIVSYQQRRRQKRRFFK